MALVLIMRRLAKVIRAGWDDEEFRGLTIVLTSWVASGTIIYALSEGWGVVDSFYFCVMTLTTIGYGDLTPTTSTMKVYTVVYAVMGIGLFVAFNAQLAKFAFASQRKDPDTTTS